jgi:hypothetical protein
VVNTLTDDHRLDLVDMLSHRHGMAGLSEETGDPLGGPCAVHGNDDFDTTSLPMTQGSSHRIGITGSGIEPAHLDGLVTGPGRDRGRFDV